MSENASQQQPRNPWPNIIFCIILPVLILMKLSPVPGAEGSPPYAIGPKWAVLLGFSFPIGYAIYEFFKTRSISIVPILGIVAVILKGLTLLFKGDPSRIVWLETCIPLALGLVCLATAWMKKPLVQRLFFNPQIIDVDKLTNGLKSQGAEERVRPLMTRVSLIYVGIMAVSAVLNFVVSKRVLQTDPKVDEVAAVQEVGRLQWVQMLAIGLPLMILTIIPLVYALKRLGKLAGVPPLHLLQGYETEEAES